MSEKKLQTHEHDLGPGVVRTPGYDAEEGTAPVSGFSDRRINHLGEVADHPTLSTYDGPISPHVSVKADHLVEDSKAEEKLAKPAKSEPAQSSGK